MVTKGPPVLRGFYKNGKVVNHKTRNWPFIWLLNDLDFANSRIPFAICFCWRQGLTKLQVWQIESNKAQESVASALWEDLHWLYLAVGHSLADEIDSGETRFIPQIVMTASVKQKAPATASLSETQDFVVQLLAVVFQAMEMEKAAMMAEICHAWSPQVSLINPTNLFWAFWTFCLSITNITY